MQLQKESIKIKKLKILFENEKNLKNKIFFFAKVTKSKLDLYKILSKLKNKNIRIYGISAPSRATTLANYVGLNSNIIDCILEIDGSKKINHYLPGTDIPIFNEKLYIDKPEYTFIFRGT